MNFKNYSLLGLVLIITGISSLLSPADAAPLLDDIQLGVSTSEQAHHFQDVGSEVIKGGLDQPARHLLPLGSTGWEGGKISFSMKVNPEKQNSFISRPPFPSP
jgi:hypothetical protein